MIRNYFKSAWRNLLKNKFYTLINIIGLTVGLAVGLLILLWVQDELSFDRFHKNTGQIYMVHTNMGTEAEKQVWDGVQVPVATWSKREISEVRNAVRIRGNYVYTLFRYKGREFSENRTAFTDPSFFQVFDFPLIKGNINQPFPSKHSILLTESTARKYFGSENPIGKTMVVNGKLNFQVSGLIRDFPANSSIQFTMLFPMALHAQDFRGNGTWKTMEEDWGNYDCETFLMLHKGANPASVEAKISIIHSKNQPGSKNTYLLQPLSHVHLYNNDGTSPRLRSVQIFIAIALLILLIASINYVNLSTARSMMRNKEVSVRKIIGASKAQLFIQFIIETLLLFSMATLLALIIILIGMPAYNSLSGKSLSFNFTDLHIWMTIGLTLLVTLLAVSIYPAILLSSFKPMDALRGRFQSGAGNAGIRKVLVTVQFMFSIALIISTLVIGNQLNYIHQKELGYDKEHVFAFGLQDSMIRHYQVIRTVLLAYPSIRSVSASDENIVRMSSSSGDADWDGKDPKSSFIIVQEGIDKSFIPAFKLAMWPGSRNFTGTAADSTHFILNETAINLMGIKNPIGKRYKFHGSNGTIIAVLKDFHFDSMKEKIRPAIFYYNPTGARTVYVRTTAGDAPAAIQASGLLYKKYSNGFPFEYEFLDERFDELYKSDTRTGALFSLFAGIAILISCLGLFGLAAFTAQIKTKEIGIRKVLGASVGCIVNLLATDFIKLVLIAVVLASPLAWLTMNSWLHDFAYHVSISGWIFVLAGFMALVIALLTVSFHAVRAALANPVKSLRSE